MICFTKVCSEPVFSLPTGWNSYLDHLDLTISAQGHKGITMLDSLAQIGQNTIPEQKC